MFDPQTQGSIKVKLTAKVSIMYVELLAIAEAVSYVASFESGNFVILTDSKSALQHLARCTSIFRGAPIAYRILETVSKMQKKNIVLQWPAHIGLYGNEVADRLAKEVVTDGLFLDCLPYFSDIIYLVRRQCIDIWKEYFDERSRTKGIWYRTIQPSLSRLPWFTGVDMHRNHIVTAFKLRSGHIPLNSFGFLMKICDSPNCDECGVVEDATHIMKECVRSEAERSGFMLEFDLCAMNVGVYNSILASPLSRAARMLYKLVDVSIKRRV